MSDRHTLMRRTIPLLLFIAGTLFFAGKLFPALPLFITDNGNKYIIMRNFAENGTLAIQHPAPELFPRGGFHFQSLPDGTIHSFHSWVLPVITALFYLIFGENLALLPVYLAGLGILLLMNRTRKQRFALYALLLTTPVWLYSLMLWEMVPSALAVLGAFILIKRRQFLGAGIIFGLGIWLREELYILGAVAGMLLLFRRQWKDASKLAGGAFAAVLPLWLINLTVYGHILGLHGATYALNNRTEPFSLSAELMGTVFNYYQHLLSFETLSPERSLQLSVVGAAALILPGVFKNIKIKLAGLVLFTLIDGIFIWNIFNSRSPLFTCGLTMSLLFTLPLAAGFFINLRQLLTDRNNFVRFTAQAVAIFILITPLFLTRFDIGLTFGARHFICIMPLLMMLSFRGFAQMRCHLMWKQTLLILLSVLGIALQVWGFKTLHMASRHSVNLENYLHTFHEKTIVTDLFFIPEEVPRSFFAKDCFEVISIEQAKTLTALLEKNHTDEFILILGQNTAFRRMDNSVLKYLLDRYPVCEKPIVVNAAPGMPIFIARCRKAQPAAR